MSRTSGARLLLLVRANVAKLSHQSLVPGDEQEQRLIVLLLDESGADASVLRIHKSSTDKGAESVPAHACCSSRLSHKGIATVATHNRPSGAS